MFANGGVRQYLKHTLSVARVKLLYERITLNRFTTLYFFSALLACFILTSLQIVSLAHDSEGVAALTSVIAGSPRLPGIAVLQGNSIQLCSGLPSEAHSICVSAIHLRNDLKERDVEDEDEDEEEDKGEDDDHHDDHHDNKKLDVTLTPIGGPIPSSTISLESLTSSSTTRSATFDIPRTSDLATSKASPQSSTTAATKTRAGSASATSATIPTATPERSTGDSSEIGDDCIVSIMWLNDVLHDAKREDIVIFVFQIWLLVLSLVTILNESIPHLGAGLLGHVLGTAWAAYRVHSTRRLMARYRNHIVPDACDGRDFMGNWWEGRIKDALPLVVLQAVALLVVSYLSFKLFRAYAHQTFKRAGASPKVHRIYKLVLMFSVCLQLSGFISIASAGMWIDKVSHGPLSGLAKHAKIYLASFILTLVLQIPWLIIGWTCVRLECHIRFFVFCLISGISLTLSIAMFASDIYRYIFSTWPFFATITITAFVLLVGTTVLGIICRMNFGQGLAHYLQVNEALEGVNFTPVYFSNDSKGDIEKSEFISQSTRLTPDDRHVIEFPVPVYAPKPAITRGSSVYSDPNASPMLLSSSPPLESDLVSNNRLSVFSRALNRLSGRAPSPGVKSLTTEPSNTRNSSLLSVNTAPRRGQRTSGLSEKDSTGLADFREPLSSSSIETLSVLSYLSSPQSVVSTDRLPNTNRSNKGLPANPRSRLISS